MADYQNFVVNSANNIGNNQFNNEMNQSVYNIMHSIDPQNGNSNGNNLVYTLPAANFTFGQPLQNAFNSQYINGLNNNIIQMSNANQQLGFYFNNSGQFTNGENFMNGISQFIPVQNFNPTMLQVGVNDTNKGSQRQTHSRKKSLDQIKPEESGEVEYDNKNRPLIYSCKECPRKFSMNSRLNTHMRCHNGERPHICTQCNFAFTQKSYLVRHAAVHKEERPYQCHACKKTYKHYGSLANHRKTHKNGRNDIMSDSGVEEVVDNQKLEPDCAVEEFQNQQYLFTEPLKQESQLSNMATDLSTQYQSSGQEISYLDQLNTYTQNGLFFNSTDTTEVLETSQSSPNQTPTFTV